MPYFRSILACTNDQHGVLPLLCAIGCSLAVVIEMVAQKNRTKETRQAVTSNRITTGFLADSKQKNIPCQSDNQALLTISFAGLGNMKPRIATGNVFNPTLQYNAWANTSTK
jgi:hypothetical protein